MKKFWRIGPALLCLSLLLTSCGEETWTNADTEDREPGVSEQESQPDQSSECAPHSVNMERVWNNVVNDRGVVLGVCYFDKPVVEGVPAAERINAYFDRECDAFFYGSNESRHYTTDQYRYFQYCVQTMSGWLASEEDLIKCPLENTVDTEVTYESDEIVSVKETWYWMAGGTADTRYFGETIDVTTGESISVDHFVRCDIEEFNGQVIKLLTDFYAAEENLISAYAIQELVENRAFEDYEYYFDGTDVYLIFEQNHYYNDGHVVPYPIE